MRQAEQADDRLEVGHSRSGQERHSSSARVSNQASRKNAEDSPPVGSSCAEKLQSELFIGSESGLTQIPFYFKRKSFSSLDRIKCALPRPCVLPGRRRLAAQFAVSRVQIRIFLRRLPLRPAPVDAGRPRQGHRSQTQGGH